ncbi:MAG: S9 family peptidase [Chlorobi bacterium]|nr:S9 family peptidase [Chlorobiota bacterium]
MKKIILFISAVFFLLFYSNAQNNRLTPEILWQFGRVSDARLSNDGKTVIYGVTRYSVSENKGNTDIWSVMANGKNVKQLTNFDGSEFNQRWSPNGNKIGFICNESGSYQIWEMNADGTDKVQISDIEGNVNSFEYSPGSEYILYTKNVKLDKKPNEIYPDLPKVNVRIIDDLMYRHWNQWSDYAYSHIFVASYLNGQLIDDADIMKGEHWDSPLSPYFDAAEITWSPNGKYIAYTCKKLTGKDYAVSTNSDIYLYNVETGETDNITEGMLGYDKYPRFSPDSKKIAWQSMETPGYESDKDRLFVMDLATGTKEYITKDFDQNVSHLVWNEDGQKIYFISGIKATYQIYNYNFELKKITQITKGVHNYNSFSKVGKTLVGERMSMSMATEIYRIDEKKGTETQITFTNQDIYNKIAMGKVEENWIKTTDGKDMLVWIIYPPDFDANKKYPALLYCQGGPQSAVSQFFSYRWNFQIMAANNYIIIAPNRRGLPTFGQEWNAQISGDYGGQNMLDYLSAVDTFKQKSFIDENRIGAVGASYGGYSVFWLAGNHQGRFKAFISHCGIFDFESMYPATDEMFFVNHDYGGAYWDKDNAEAQKSYTFSPHKYVQNWDTPIMIVTGGNDLRIPYTQSLEAFGAAQMLGVPSKLLYFPNETHFVLKPQNSILWQREFFNWFDKYLK